MIAAAPTERPLSWTVNKSSALWSIDASGGPRMVVIPNLPIGFPTLRDEGSLSVQRFKDSIVLANYYIRVSLTIVNSMNYSLTPLGAKAKGRISSEHHGFKSYDVAAKS